MTSIAATESASPSRSSRYRASIGKWEPGLETPKQTARPATEAGHAGKSRKTTPPRPASMPPKSAKPATRGTRTRKTDQAHVSGEAASARRTTGGSASGRRAGERAPQRVTTSRLLRQILTKNPTMETFTIEHIVESMSEGGLAQPLLLFSVPGMLPVPETATLTGLPASAIAGHMIIGRHKIELPQFIRERTVPRRSLAVAIHSVLPVLERLEKATKRRWLWVSHPIAQRMLGVLLFVLAVTVAFPLVGFTLPHAAAMFTITLGVAEQDGLAILLGVAAGIAALVLVSGRDLTFTALRTKAWKWMRGLARKFTGSVLKKLGFNWASLISFDWSQLLLLWNPERSRGKSGEAKATGRRKAQPLPSPAPAAVGTTVRPRALAPSLVPV